MLQTQSHEYQAGLIRRATGRTDPDEIAEIACSMRGDAAVSGLAPWRAARAAESILVMVGALEAA